MNYFINTLKNHYADFAGRASRSEYWFFALFQFITMVVLLILATLAGDSAVGKLFMVLYALAALAFFLPALSLAVRRLHDTDRSGWWFFIGFVPFVGTLILLVFMLLPSFPGQNRFGDVPKPLN